MLRPFMVLVALLAGGAQASSLRVRVLEQKRLSSATVTARGPLLCDGQKVGAKALMLQALGSALQLEGGRRCDELLGSDATVSFGAQARSYRGQLRVSASGGTLTFLNQLELEDYLRSVVAAEMDGPLAALEAQAVASRTFALASRARHGAYGYELCDLTHCQLYAGRTVERADASAAVQATRGQVLLLGGVLQSPAYFHSSCGGATSSAADVFGEEGVPGGVNDSGATGPLCAGASDFEWQWAVERGALARALGRKDLGPAFEVLRRDRAGRVVELRSFGERHGGAEFLARVGRSFGYQKLRSMKVAATEALGTVTFRGRGLGHGVGLCQSGAVELARQKANYRSILFRYFPERRLASPGATAR